MPYAKTPARLMLIGLTLLMTACSQDKGTYYSTPYQPINYEVIDPGNGEILWSMEIPVNHRLEVDFDRSGNLEFFGVDPREPATRFGWALFTLRGKRVDFGHVNLPNTPVMQRYTLRPVPEYPDDYVPPSIQQALPPEPQPADMPEPEAEQAEAEQADGDPDDDVDTDVDTDDGEEHEHDDPDEDEDEDHDEDDDDEDEDEDEDE